MPREKLMTVEEVAEELQVKPLTVYRMVKHKLISSYHIGPGKKQKNIRFKPSEVDAYLQRCRMRGADEILEQEEREPHE